MVLVESVVVVCCLAGTLVAASGGLSVVAVPSAVVVRASLAGNAADQVVFSVVQVRSDRALLRAAAVPPGALLSVLRSVLLASGAPCRGRGWACR